MFRNDELHDASKYTNVFNEAKTRENRGGGDRGGFGGGGGGYGRRY